MGAFFFPGTRVFFVCKSKIKQLPSVSYPYQVGEYQDKMKMIHDSKVFSRVSSTVRIPFGSTDTKQVNTSMDVWMFVRYAVRPGIKLKDSKYIHTGNLQILDNVNVEVPGLPCTYKIISHVIMFWLTEPLLPYHTGRQSTQSDSIDLSRRMVRSTSYTIPDHFDSLELNRAHGVWKW